LFSFFQFGFDQIQANRNERENRDLRASVERVERSLAEIAPVEEPVGFIPLLARSTSAGANDNVFFQRDHMGQSKAWIEANVQGAFTAPFVYTASISSQAEKDFVQLAPYMLVNVLSVTPVPRDLAGIYQGERGAAASVRDFAVVVTPSVGLQVAPLVDAESGEYRRDVDFFTLMPGEIEEWALTISFVPGYVYEWRYGVQYRYKGEDRVLWLADVARAGMPDYELPIAGWDEARYENGYYEDRRPPFDSYYQQAEANSAFVARNRVFNIAQTGLSVAAR